MKRQETFLDILQRSDSEKLLPQGNCAGAAAQAMKPAGSVSSDEMEFGFATGIECSNPNIAGEDGQRIRRDLLDECGHYDHCRADLELVKEMNIPFLRYGVPNHRIHLGPGRYD